MSEDDPQGLDLRAYLALQRASLDWRRDLATLMRSDVPLSRLLRDRLADAFDNEAKEGPRLELKNHKVHRDAFAKLVVLHDRMRIGRWVARRRDEGATAAQANEEAAAYFRVSQKTVEPAFAYFNKASVWIDAAMDSEAGQTLGREMVERLYHSIAAQPAFKKANAGLIQQLGLSH